MPNRAKCITAGTILGCVAVTLVAGGAGAAFGATAAPVPAAGSPSTVISVSTAAQLSSALSAVKPGDTISLAKGNYSGTFVETTSGTASAPITLTGPATAILNNGDTSGAIGSGYGFHLEA